MDKEHFPEISMCYQSMGWCIMANIWVWPFAKQYSQPSTGDKSFKIYNNCQWMLWLLSPFCQMGALRHRGWVPVEGYVEGTLWSHVAWCLNCDHLEEHVLLLYFVHLNFCTIFVAGSSAMPVIQWTRLSIPGSVRAGWVWLHAWNFCAVWGITSFVLVSAGRVVYLVLGPSSHFSFPLSSFS